MFKLFHLPYSFFLELLVDLSVFLVSHKDHFTLGGQYQLSDRCAQCGSCLDVQYPSIFRLGVMGLYHSVQVHVGITAQLSYRQEFGQVTEREVGPGSGVDGLEWRYHFVQSGNDAGISRRM